MAYSEWHLVAKTKSYHVSNVKLLDYLDQARTEWYHFCKGLGVEAVVVHISADYKKEVFDGDPIMIRTWMERVGNTSFAIKQIMEREPLERIVEAEVILTTIDCQSRIKVSVPFEVRQLLHQDINLKTVLTCED
ncbi:acyl-CoA thioesterase [Cytobacillus sp. Hz8]|uniref:acyl-CoA thioesterase n=1 Tax=Cytobacillus sp. Hz8 TaxID=3347168 RepID=UPI0035E12DFE